MRLLVLTLALAAAAALGGGVAGAELEAAVADRPAAKQPPKKKKKPPAVLCRQREQLRKRNCPEWIDYAVFVTYRGTETTKLEVVSLGRLPSSERTKTITWQARSAPVRVHRPSRRGHGFQLGQVDLEGTFRSDELGKSYGYCRGEVAVVEAATAVRDARIRLRASLPVQHWPDRAAELRTLLHGYFGRGVATGSLGIARSGQTFTGGAACSKLDVSGTHGVEDYTTTAVTLAFPATPRCRAGQGWGKVEYGDRVIASGDVQCSAADSEATASAETTATYNVTFVCKGTSRGRC